MNLEKVRLELEARKALANALRDLNALDRDSDSGYREELRQELEAIVDRSRDIVMELFNDG